MNLSADDIFVFLGPSLPLKEAKALLDARYFPPAKQGDILSLTVQFHPKIIALIDGFFMQALPVWHKEILYALEQGVVVLGASSMGALRAAEMADFGMIGVGKIFERYRSAAIIDDDEVVLMHGPSEEDYLPLSLPLINIRFTLELAQQEGRMSEELCQSILCCAQSLHYPERTIEKIMQRAQKMGVSAELLNLVIDSLQHHYVDQKRKDGLFLLEKIKTGLFVPPSAKSDFFQSSVFEILYNYDRCHLFSSTDISQREIAHYVALHHPRFPELQFQALNQVLTSLLAKILKIEVNKEDIEKEIRRFCLYNRLLLLGEKEWNNWLISNHLSKEEFNDLMKERAKTRKLQKSLCVGQIPWKQVKYLLNELKLDNKYEEWIEKAVNAKQMINEKCPHYLETHQEELYNEELVEAHLKESSWNPDLPYREWALESGFQDIAELKAEMLKAQITRNY